MTPHPIHDAVAAARRELAQHGIQIDWFRPYHHTNTQGDTVAINNLVETIKADLAAAGHTVDQAVHDVLTHRLNIVSVLSYAAEEMNRVQSSPLAGLVERYIGLPPAAVETVVHFADLGAQEAVKLLGGVPAGPQPEPAPAA